VKWLLRMYPRRWRDRYGDELLCLLEQRDLSASVILDMVRGAVDAWLHPDLVRTAASVAVGAQRQRRGRFDKFTSRSKTVLHLAEQEAIRMHHGHIGTEHLLIGLLLEGKGVAAHVLADRGVNLDELRATILPAMAYAAAGNAQLLGLSPEAKKAIQLSVNEANCLRHDYIGTEHLLLGLVALQQGVAADALRQHNAGDLASLRVHIQRVLEAGPHIRPLL